MNGRDGGNQAGNPKAFFQRFGQRFGAAKAVSGSCRAHRDGDPFGHPFGDLWHYAPQIAEEASRPLLRSRGCATRPPAAVNHQRDSVPSLSQAGALHARSHAVQPDQGRGARPGRGPHRIHPGLVDRAPVADPAVLRLRRRGVRQDLRGADPARRGAGDPVDLFHPAVEDLPRHVHRSAGAPVRDRRAAGVPAGGDRRRGRAQLHQERAVQPLGGLLHADCRRRHSAMGRPARPQAEVITTPPRSPCRCTWRSACSSASR